MNLHNLVRGAIGSINPDIPVSVQRSLGYGIAPDGTQVPAYDVPVSLMGQVQELSAADLQKLDGLNIQGARRSVYLNGQWNGMLRSDGKGGDLLTFQNRLWLVAAVLEQWPDWTRVAVMMQTAGPPPSVYPLVGIGTSGPYVPLLSGHNIWSGAQVHEPHILTDGPVIVPDFAISNNFRLTLAGDRLLANPVNAVAGQAGQITVWADQIAARTLIYGTYYINAPPMVTAAGGLSVLSYYVEDATHIIVSGIVNIS